MTKTILIGVAAFGGLVLISSLFFGNHTQEEQTAQEVETAKTLTLADVQSLGVPVYPEAELARVTDTQQDGKRFLTLSLQSHASIQTINEWYAGALSTNSWSIKSDKNIGGYRLIQSENAEKYTSMQAARSGEEGVVTISQQIRIGN